jgi:hypothetical protein
MNIMSSTLPAPVPCARDGRPRSRSNRLWGVVLALFCASAAAQTGGAWTGELTLTIKGQGSFDDGTLKANWNVDRVARATVVLDRMFRGGGIAGTRDTRNTERYETWVATRSQPAQLVIDDSGEFDGPLFDPRNYRRDTMRWTCPSRTAPRPGELRASILQIDHHEGTVTWEVPRIFTACDKYFRFDFHKGLPNFVRNGTQMNEEGVELAFEVVHRLTSPKEWWHLTVPFKAGQTEVVLSRPLRFEWPLRTESRRAPLDGELTLVLRKSP